MLGNQFLTQQKVNFQCVVRCMHNFAMGANEKKKERKGERAESTTAPEFTIILH